MVSIVNLFVNHRKQPIIAHVRAGNKGPCNILRDLGFEIYEINKPYIASQYQGLEHMEADEQGKVYADVYHFNVS